jgi:hypothetical protein
MKTCPLCLETKSELFFTKKKSQKNYWDCANCKLIFLDEQSILATEQEFQHYHTHNNDIHDPRYQHFVSDITDYVKSNLKSDTVGLDYGAGPGPVITHVLQEAGYSLEVYDPYFHPHKEVLQRKYDFIVSCEVMEHFNRPAAEFAKLSLLLNENSPLILKSHFYKDEIDFPTWYYHADPTHISFYRKDSLEWIRSAFAFKKLEILSDRLCVFWK